VYETSTDGGRMMAISGKYGKVHIPKIGEDEPIFVLRAQDQLAVSAIEMYQSLAASHGSTVGKSLSDEIASFRNWKGRKKIPD
jgi:hypothetical protein